MRLKDKKALITGGSTGIGFAAARAFLDEGAQVVISGHDPDRLAQAASDLGGSVQTVAGDLRSVTEAQRVVRDAVGALGGLDVLFLNAGMVIPGPLEHITEQSVDDQIALHVKAPLFMVQAAAEHLSQGASVVLNTSVNGDMGMAGMGVYAASKAAQRSLARTLAGELVAQGVRVNVISPGPIETPIYGKLGMEADQVEAMAGQLLTKIPMNRFGSADEVARGVVFLASGDSSFMTGSEIVVDGGWTGV